MRQLLGALPLPDDDRLLPAWLQRDERHDRDALRIPSAYDSGTSDFLVAVQGGFDLAELDPVSAPLDHPIAPPVKLQAAAAVIEHEVTRPVPERAAGVA